MADIEVAGLVAKISIDDNDVEQSMAKLNRQMNIAKSEFTAAGAGIDKFGKGTAGLKVQSEGLSKQLQIQGQRVAKLQEEHAKSVREKGADAVATEKLEVKLNKAVGEYNRLHGRLESVNKELAVQSSAFTKVGSALETAGGKLTSVGKGMETAGNTLTKTVTAPLLAVGGLAFKASVDYESAFAGVKKTVDASAEDLAKLSDGIREMSKEIPASATAIAGIAEAAGQLGIEVPNIMGFTRTMIDLGEATNMNAEEAATSLARFANITQMSQDDFDKLGSVIVDLGNNLATTEKNIVDMGMRLAGAGSQIGLTEAQIMGFAGALSSVGIEAEAGGSAFSKTMINMQLAVETNSEGLKDYAKVAGMTTKDFKKAFEQDAAGALISFIEGLGSAEERGLSTIKVLDDMGITEVRLRDTLLRAAGASDIFTDSIQMGTDAWAENTALQDEASQRYETTASQLAILKNRMTDTGIELGQALIPAVMDALDAAEPLFKAIEGGAKAFSELDTAQQRNILKWAGFALAAGPVLSITGKLTQGVGGLVTGLGKASTWVGKFAGASKGAVGAVGGIASATTGATGATAGFASLLNPLTIGLGVAAGAVGLYALAYKKSLQPIKDAEEAGVSFFEGIAGWNSTVAGATSALDGFNMELIFSSEKMNTLESNIKETQQKIIGIAEIAASESRDYTEKERKELEELTGLLAEYTAEKMEMLQERSRTTRALVEAETDMSIERASQLAKAEQDTREMIISEADKTYTDRIALAEKQYGHLGETDKKAYEDTISQARRQRDEKIAIADEEASLTLEAIQRKYADQHQEDMKYLENLASAGEEVRRLEDERTKFIEEQSEKRGLDRMDETTRSMFQWIIENQAHWKFNKDTKDAYKDLEKAYSEAEDANLNTWLGMLNDVTKYGGDITDENKAIVQGILSAFDGLPDDARKALESVMDGMIKGIDNKRGQVFKKASGVAQGVLDRTRSVYQTHSPSKAMEDIYDDLFAGAYKPMDKAEIEIPARVGRIANETLDASRPPAIPETIGRSETVTRNYSSQKVDHTGVIRVEGVNDRNELMGVVELVKEQLRWEARMA